MTDIPAPEDGATADSAASAAASLPAPPVTARVSRSRRSRPDAPDAAGTATVRRWIWALEHAQDVVAVGVGLVLIALAATLLISAVVDFADGIYGSIAAAAPLLLDRVLLVLILVEIVHTVVLSLRAHKLVAQPFIVVGLIAVIRRILVVLTPGGHASVSVPELGLLIGMIAVFVAGLIAVSIFEEGSGLPGQG